MGSEGLRTIGVGKETKVHSENYGKLYSYNIRHPAHDGTLDIACQARENPTKNQRQSGRFLTSICTCPETNTKAVYVITLTRHMRFSVCLIAF